MRQRDGRLTVPQSRSESFRYRADGFALRWGWRIGVPVFAALVLPVIISDIGPAWAAHLKDGVPGTFTALVGNCGGRGPCTWRGDFVSDDGTLRRTDVGLASGGDIDRVGDWTRAIDTGNRVNVYPAGGGWDWLLVSMFLVFVGGLAALWVLDMLGRIGRRMWPERKVSDSGGVLTVAAPRGLAWLIRTFRGRRR